ncbi:hypothetical protein LWI28_000744 [Acer negundo]|uniref:Uncharacterized protein n=1 Tax=Acer negundo TaxID=4023 RepID=A0AAD5INK0_ACENE|nr:hypothetical protein LWI28_000744 [Acer negundo]
MSERSRDMMGTSVVAASVVLVLLDGVFYALEGRCGCWGSYIMRQGNSNSVETNQQLLETLNNGDLPIARRKSLQRFLEKRKKSLARLTCGSNVLRLDEVIS